MTDVRADLLRMAVPSRRFPLEIPNTGRDMLAGWFADWGFTRGAEIGVEQGLFSEQLCRVNPGLHLLCVDPWKAYRGYREHVSQAKLDQFAESTRTRLARFSVDLLRRSSVEAAAHVADRSLDFVYIDANHELSHVIADLTAWTPKVRPGGVIAGHDYCRRKQSGYRSHVVPAVHAFTDAWQIAPWFVLGTKAAVPGQVRDKSRSFLWVVA